MLDAKCKEPFKDRISNSIVNVKKKGWSMCKNHLGRRRPSWWTMPIFSALLSSSELCSLSICLLPSLQANHIHKRLTCNIFFTIQELFVHAKLFRSRMWSKGGWNQPFNALNFGELYNLTCHHFDQKWKSLLFDGIYGPSNNLLAKLVCVNAVDDQKWKVWFWI